MDSTPVQWIQLGIQLVVFLTSGISAVVAVVWSLSKHERKLDDKVSSLLAAAQQINGEKIQRVYARLDEYKNYTETSFVRKDMCGVLHNTTASAVSEMRKEMKVEIDNLSREISELKTLIIRGRDNGTDSVR